MSIFTYENLYRAYLDCRKNKRKTINALKFEMNMEKNLADLMTELKKRTYVPGRSICFVVTEPVPREIFAADFRDRIVHHLLVREVILYAENKFIFDSYACRKGKGTLLAVKRLQKFIGRITNGGTEKAYYAQMDIKSFFMQIDQRILYGLFEKLVRGIKKPDIKTEENWKEEVLWLGKTIIFHQPGQNYLIKGQISLFDLIPDEKSLLKQPEGKGLPIGNYTSQFFANLYLNKLDHFVKRNLKCEFYARYVDDFILISADKEALIRWQNQIRDFILKKLNLALSDEKTILQPVKRGIDFLGYFVKPDSIYSRRSVFKRYKNKLFKMAVGERFKNLKYIQSMNNSYIGHFEFKGKFPARVRDRFLTFAERAKLPASISAAS